MLTLAYLRSNWWYVEIGSKLICCKSYIMKRTQIGIIVASFLGTHNDRGKQLALGFQLYYTTVQTRAGHNVACRLLSQCPDCFRTPGPFLRGPYTYESGSRVRLGSGSNEPNSSMCGSPRAGLGRVQRGSPGPSVGLGSATARYWFVRVWAVPSQTRVSTRHILLLEPCI